MKELIQKLEARALPVQIGDQRISTPTDCIPLDTAIALIREAFEGKTLVPSGFLMAADCPNTECSGGVIARWVGDEEWEPEQCQWCDERELMLKAQGVNDNG